MPVAAFTHSWLNQFDGEPVVQWRAKTLLRGGYNEFQAARLAVSHCDVHKAVELLRDGCAPATALDLMLDFDQMEAE